MKPFIGGRKWASIHVKDSNIDSLGTDNSKLWGLFIPMSPIERREESIDMFLSPPCLLCPLLKWKATSVPQWTAITSRVKDFTSANGQGGGRLVTMWSWPWAVVRLELTTRVQSLRWEYPHGHTHNLGGVIKLISESRFTKYYWSSSESILYG